MTPPIEFELKFRVRDPAAAARYLDAATLLGFVPAGAATTVRLEDRYVDTADEALSRAGYAARLRTTSAGTIVTVKSTERSAGDEGGRAVHRRDELEGAADPSRPPREWPGSAARDLILEITHDAPVVELATIRQVRRQRRLRDPGTVIELSLDDVDVLSASRTVGRFVELEVELIGGDEARLIELGEVMATDPALEAAQGSKLDAARALIES